MHVDVDGELPVPELADVEVAGLPVEPGLGPLPAQEDVAGGLHEPLAGHDPLALVGVLAGAHVPAEHRLRGLLDLEEQRVVSSRPSISTIQQRVPTLPTPTTLWARSANWNWSSRSRRSVSRVRRYLPIRSDSSDSMNLRSAWRSAASSSIGHHQRRVGDDPRPAVHHAGQLVDLLHAVPGPGLGQALADLLALPRPVSRAPNRRRSSSMSACAYQTSRSLMPANWRMASR